MFIFSTASKTKCIKWNEKSVNTERETKLEVKVHQKLKKQNSPNLVYNAFQTARIFFLNKNIYHTQNDV